jgi:hypothetical protein
MTWRAWWWEWRSESRAWQFGVFGMLMAGCLWIAFKQLKRRRADGAFAWKAVVPRLISFGYCPAALLVWRMFERSHWLISLWVLRVALAPAHRAARFRRSLELGDEPAAELRSS